MQPAGKPQKHWHSGKKETREKGGDNGEVTTEGFSSLQGYVRYSDNHFLAISRSPNRKTAELFLAHQMLMNLAKSAVIPLGY